MKEADIQKAIIKWSQQPKVRNTFPDLKMLYHVPNERLCSGRQGMELKRMGVKKGVPDLVLPVPSNGFNGLYIELKTTTGTLSEEQKWWLNELKIRGYMAVVCYGFEEAINVLICYLSGKDNKNAG